jgi:acyl-CoA thioester hydrolase
MAPFRYTLRVRFNECDPQNVAFNANYLTYIDIAITDLYRQHFGASYAAVMSSSGVDVVVAEAKLKFLAPARFDDQIEVAITVERLGDTSMEVSALISGDGKELVVGELRYVFVDIESWKKTPIPDQIRATMAQFGPG